MLYALVRTIVSFFTTSRLLATEEVYIENTTQVRDELHKTP